MGQAPGWGGGEEESESTTEVSSSIEKYFYKCGCLSCGDEWTSQSIPKWCGICRGVAYYY